MAEEAAPAAGAAPTVAAETVVIHTYPLVRLQESGFQNGFQGSVPDGTKHTDMNEEMKNEAVEISVTACEKHAANNELAARMIKETMDKKFGPSFHVTVGESYGFEVTHESTTICYLYFGGNQAVVIWKCS